MTSLDLACRKCLGVILVDARGRYNGHERLVREADFAEAARFLELLLDTVARSSIRA